MESGPADFYSSRLPVRQRKQTLVDELLASEELRRYHKKKYLSCSYMYSYTSNIVLDWGCPYT